MSWNYRVIYHPPSSDMIGQKKFEREEYLSIHEVYYDKDNDPQMMTENGIIVGDEGKDSLLSLKWVLEKMLVALDKPILNTNMVKIEKEKQNEFSKSIETEEQISTENSSTPN